ncbi:MAG: M20 family metallopeptidase, partial [Syntrophorhabdus aromaticivorans]|nr:M20 family metallopeptidase [Syntrophorhabdus aromaticivorans]
NTVGSPGAKGSSDVGNVSYRCPALQPKLSIVDEVMASHTHEFAEATTKQKAHEALVTGAKLMARIALEVFLDEGLRKRIREDFEKEKVKAGSCI